MNALIIQAIQAISLGMAIFWTNVLIGKYIGFHINGMRNDSASFLLDFYYYVALCWAIFFFLMRF